MARLILTVTALLAVATAGCGGDRAASATWSADDDTAPEDGGDTDSCFIHDYLYGSGAWPSESDCGDGVDNDLDGRVDCEDGDCWDIAGCIEDCISGADDDGDGLIDCADDDCFGLPGCPVEVRAQLQSAAGFRLGWADFYGTTICSESCSIHGDGSGSRAAIISPTGVFSARMSSSGPWVPCTWRADRTVWWVPWYTTGSWAVQREGLRVGSGCPSAAHLLPRSLAVGSATIGVGALGGGSPWAVINSTDTTSEWAFYEASTSMWGCRVHEGTWVDGSVRGVGPGAWHTWP